MCHMYGIYQAVSTCMQLPQYDYMNHAAYICYSNCYEHLFARTCILSLLFSMVSDGTYNALLSMNARCVATVNSAHQCLHLSLLSIHPYPVWFSPSLSLYIQALVHMAQWGKMLERRSRLYGQKPLCCIAIMPVDYS